MYIFELNACLWQILQSRCVCCMVQTISHIQPLFRGWCQVGKENTLGSVSTCLQWWGRHEAMQLARQCRWC